MIKVGLTGGIGAGKSYVAHIFRMMDIPVYDADGKAKELMNFHPELKEKIMTLLGTQSYNKKGLDRRYVAGKVFGSDSLLKSLNDIVHPAVYLDFDIWSSKQDSEVVMKESALLLQVDGNKGLDKIVLIEADLEVRITRTENRDTFRSTEEIKAIIEKQSDYSKHTNLIDYVVYNNEKEMLVPQVAKIKKQLELASLS